MILGRAKNKFEFENFFNSHNLLETFKRYEIFVTEMANVFPKNILSKFKLNNKQAEIIVRSFIKFFTFPTNETKNYDTYFNKEKMEASFGVMKRDQFSADKQIKDFFFAEYNFKDFDDQLKLNNLKKDSKQFKESLPELANRTYMKKKDYDALAVMTALIINFKKFCKKDDFFKLNQEKMGTYEDYLEKIKIPMEFIEKYRNYSLDEIFKYGFDDMINLENKFPIKINWQSNAGYPHFETKYEVLKNGYNALKTEASLAFKMRRPGQVMTVFNKAEFKPKEGKLEYNCMRPVLCSDFVEFIVRMYDQQNFNKYLANNHEEQLTANGFNFFSQGDKWLFNILKKKKENDLYEIGDYSKWDNRLSAEIITTMNICHEQLYLLNDISRSVELDCNYFNMVNSNLVFSDGTLHTKYSMMQSGFESTLGCNSIANSFVSCYAEALILNRLFEVDETIIRINDQTQLFQGDDNVKRFDVEFYNLIKDDFGKIVNKMGNVYVTKLVTDIKEIEFLRHIPIMSDGQLRMTRRPLDVVFKIIYNNFNEKDTNLDIGTREGKIKKLQYYKTIGFSMLLEGFFDRKIRDMMYGFERKINSLYYEISGERICPLLPEPNKLIDFEKARFYENLRLNEFNYFDDKRILEMYDEKLRKNQNVYESVNKLAIMNIDKLKKYSLEFDYDIDIKQSFHYKQFDYDSAMSLRSKNRELRRRSKENYVSRQYIFPYKLYKMESVGELKCNYVLGKYYNLWKEMKVSTILEIGGHPGGSTLILARVFSLSGQTIKSYSLYPRIDEERQKMFYYHYLNKKDKYPVINKKVDISLANIEIKQKYDFCYMDMYPTGETYNQPEMERNFLNSLNKYIVDFEKNQAWPGIMYIKFPTLLLKDTKTIIIKLCGHYTIFELVKIKCTGSWNSEVFLFLAKKREFTTENKKIIEENFDQFRNAIGQRIFKMEQLRERAKLLDLKNPLQNDVKFQEAFRRTCIVDNFDV